LSTEVPLANHASNEHLLLANDEREDPEEAKEEIPEDVSLFLSLCDLWSKLILLELNSADTV